MGRTLGEKRLSIPAWSSQDKPREKFEIKGKFSLSEAELLAILLRTGSPTSSAVDLARQILSQADNDLHNLASFTLSDFLKIRGVGKAKALAILAALELGRRRKEAESRPRPLITESIAAYAQLKQELMDLEHEEFWVLLLNRSNHLIRKQQVSQGGVAGTVVDSKIVFKMALDALACGIILAHNHPSGNISPSDADIKLTNKLRDAGILLDIHILDHVIVGGQDYFSFADKGLL